MKKTRLFMLMGVILLSLTLVGMSLAADNTPKDPPLEQVAFTGVSPFDKGGINSLSGSNVTFNPSAGGETCYIPGASQTFCFDTHSYTTDWEYVYNLWMEFPADWIVTDAYVVGTPTCTGGGTWGDFEYSFETSPYEVNIAHSRYQAYTDDCLATYCFEVVAGTGIPSAEESWYWDGDGYNSAPHNPCSEDQYTPASMSGQPCDQYVSPQAEIPACALDPGLYLLPPTQEASGCNGLPQEHTLSLLNNTGTTGTFTLSYSVPSGNGTLSGPATVTAAQMEVVPFDVTLTPDLCSIGGDTVVGQVDGAGNSYTDSALINKEVTNEPSWDAIPGSAPSWAGFGYPRDGCTAQNAAGDWVTYVIGDQSDIFGFWGYNHDTNTWSQPNPTDLPADRWAPDWAYDPDTNLCYVTGGANTPGGGTYNTAYVYNPVANSFAQLGNFTSMRDFHNSWVGTIDGIKYLCIGGGVNSSSVMIQSTQCYDLAQAAPGVWNTENAQMAAFPTDPFGAADGVLDAVTGDQFWYVGGAVSAGASITDEARYWDDADNAWHQAGNTGVPRYRVEGDFLDGSFYLLGGSSGGFTPTDTAVKGTFDGINWVWTALPNLNNVRMDNIAIAADGTMWSVDGYGDSASAYVEELSFCPLCDLQGWLEGTVLDGDTQLPLGTDASCTSPEVDINQAGVNSLSGSFVAFDPTAGGDTCYNPGEPHTFCFRTETFTGDYEYRYGEWFKFPADWIADNAYLVGTPVCDSGTTWGSFSWSFETSPYEIEIYHPAYQEPTDHCVATYCVDVTTGAEVGNVGVSWYYDGDGYNFAPHHPCSSDQYTPASMIAEPCDQWVNPLATVPSCALLGPTCQNATVTINPGNITVNVDPADGSYGPVMLIQGDYTVEASAPGYSVETAGVNIVDEMTTVQDFVLYRPVIDVTPSDPISVSAPPNTPVVVPLEIANNGHLPLDWEFVEIAGENVSSIPAGTYKQQPAASGMDGFITQQLAASTDGKADVFIAFKDTADLSGAYDLTVKGDKVIFVRDALRNAADTAQANVRLWLVQHGISYKVFYVDNTLLVHIDQATIDALSAFPEISGFHGNHIYTLLPDTPSWFLREFTVNLPDEGPNATIPWDLNIMSIPQVWNDLGVTGEGVIVANVDTGVYYQHEALFPNYMCGSGPHADCWEDPDGGTTSPNDGNGHGTGTMSQMAADNNAAFQYAVGGAPDAGWIACLGCPGGSCPDTALNGCADWLVMTTPNTPDLVNNSWGTWAALCDPWYDGKIDAYRAAGIVPVWAAGNIGNACGTSTPPANSIGTLAVGATTSGDVQASFSSTGPGLCSGRTQFPDVSAPGDATCGATNSGGYTCGLGGTSFAAPRAAGCLALMKSAAPGATVDQLMQVIMATADDKPDSSCGAPQPDPNYRYGEGRVNCFEAVSAIYNADLDWVSEAPMTGTLPALSTQDVDVTFECSPAQEGFILTGELRLNHNDPCEDPISIPIEMTCGTPTAPDIVVTPPDLSSNLLEGQTEVQELNIDNVGTLPLDWSIIEHNSGAVSMPVLPLRIEKQGSETSGSLIKTSAGLTAQSSSLGIPSISQNPAAVLWDQPIGTTGYGGVSDYDIIGLFGAYSTDDFENTELWAIDTIFVDGFDQAANLLRATSLTWYIYPDDNGVPAGYPGDGTSAAIWSLSLAPNDPAVTIGTDNPQDVTVDLTMASGIINLPPGHYWLVFYPSLDWTPGIYYWYFAGTANLNHPQLIDPTDSFGAGFTDWTDWTTIDPAYTDMAFRLEGSVVAVPPNCEPVDIPWASVNPTSGTIPGHEGFVVDVTFDATGLASGTYTANLCVQSNDPDSPYVEVPLELTVQSLPDIEVTPKSFDKLLAPDEIAVEPLSICNDGDLPLNWEMTEISGTLKYVGKEINIHVPAIKAQFNEASRSVPKDVPARDITIHVGWVSAAGIDVLLVTPDVVAGGDISLLLATLDVFPDLNVTVWDGNSGTPTVSDMQNYDVVFVGNDILWSSSAIDKTALSNNLADYIDVGGKVIAGSFVWSYDDWGFGGGSFITEDYSPYEIATTDIWDPATLGTFDPNHPLMDGVTTVNDYFNHQNPVLSSTGVLVASWSDGENFVAVSPDVVGLNQEYFQAADFDGQVGELLHNAFLYLSVPPVDVPWLSEDPTEGSVAGLSCGEVDVTFNSTGLADGVYHAGLVIQSNDLDEPEVTIPVTLTVATYVPTADLELIKSSPDEVTVGDTFSYTVEVTNLGPDPASGVKVVDTLPDLVEFVSAVGCTEAAGVVTCNIIGSLAVDDPVTFTIYVTAVGEGTATNIAVVSSVAPDDPVMANNTDEVDTTINPALPEFIYFYLPILEKH